MTAYYEVPGHPGRYQADWVAQLDAETYDGQRHTPRYEVPYMDLGTRALDIPSAYTASKFAKPNTDGNSSHQTKGTDYIVEVPRDAADERPSMVVVELSRVVARELGVRIHTIPTAPAADIGSVAVGEPHFDQVVGL